MATNVLATKFPARQVPKAKTGAERAKAYRQRKRPRPPRLQMPDTVRMPFASIALMIAAAGLAAVGVPQNGWFARSLGATETAGYLFLAVGMAADLAALALPAAAAGRGRRISGAPRWPVGWSGL